MVSKDFFAKPELESWQRDILDAFYTLARGRQGGFGDNPIPLSDMAILIALNPVVGFYYPLDLIDLWQSLDAAMLRYWTEKRKADEKRKAELKELQEKAGKGNGQPVEDQGHGS